MSSAIATEQGPVRILGNLAYAATRTCARQNWLKVSTVPGSRYVRPGPAGSTYGVEFSGKKCAYEKSARSIEKFAYGVCGRKFGPCLPSAARYFNTAVILLSRVKLYKKAKCVLIHFAFSFNYSFDFLITD